MQESRQYVLLFSWRPA